VVEFINYQLFADVLWYTGHVLGAISFLVNHFKWYGGLIVIGIGQFLTIISRPIGRINQSNDQPLGENKHKLADDTSPSPDFDEKKEEKEDEEKQKEKEETQKLQNKWHQKINYQFVADILWYCGHSLIAFAVLAGHWVWYAGLVIVCVAQFLAIISRPIGRITF